MSRVSFCYIWSTFTVQYLRYFFVRSLSVPIHFFCMYCTMYTLHQCKYVWCVRFAIAISFGGFSCSFRQILCRKLFFPSISVYFSTRQMYVSFDGWTSAMACHLLYAPWLRGHSCPYSYIPLCI